MRARRRFRGKIADCGMVAVIPYPSNQRKGEDVLRVDKFFRVYGSAEEERAHEDEDGEDLQGLH